MHEKTTNGETRKMLHNMIVMSHARKMTATQPEAVLKSSSRNEQHTLLHEDGEPSQPCGRGGLDAERDESGQRGRDQEQQHRHSKDHGGQVGGWVTVGGWTREGKVVIVVDRLFYFATLCPLVLHNQDTLCFSDTWLV